MHRYKFHVNKQFVGCNLEAVGYIVWAIKHSKTGLKKNQTSHN